MSKLLSVLLISIIVLGLAIFILSGDDGIKETVIEGHDRVTEKVRTFDYHSD